MDLFAYEKHLTRREQAILSDLLKYRVMTTDMLDRKHFDRKSNYVNVVLHNLRKTGYIKSSILSKSRKGRKGYAYHMITETGKECLARHDLSVEGTDRNIYLHEYQIPNLLLANEVLIEYEMMGWQVWDSRKVKSEYRMDYRSNIHGLLISPSGKRYGLYALETRVTQNVVGRIQQEIIKYQNQIKNYMVLAKGADSFNLFVEMGFREDAKEGKRPLVTIGDLIIESFYINFMKRRNFENETDWLYRLCEQLEIKLISIEPRESRQSFPVIVEYKGEEMYLVDVTDSDLNKYQSIKAYNQAIASKNWDKNRKVLAVSLGIDTVPNLMLDDKETCPFVEHLTLSGSQFQEICQATTSSVKK